MNFKLKARVSRSDARTIQHALEQLAAKGSVSKAAGELIVEAEMEGASPNTVHLMILTDLEKSIRRVRPRLRGRRL